MRTNELGAIWRVRIASRILAINPRKITRPANMTHVEIIRFRAWLEVGGEPDGGAREPSILLIAILGGLAERGNQLSTVRFMTVGNALQ